jgi:glycosyltransferase involved in cell wall biosynthesis
LYRGFGELGLEVAPLVAEPRRVVRAVAAQIFAAGRLARTPGDTLKERLQTSRTVALFTGPELTGLRTRALRRDLDRVGRLDAIVQIATGYEVPAGQRIATYEDMTVVQALRLPYPEWQALSSEERSNAIARQRRAYERAEVCCFATSWAAESALHDYGLDPAKVFTVGVGRNHEPKPTQKDWSAPRYLFVGADWERKNGAAVVRAFADVHRRIHSARLDLVGEHPHVTQAGVHCHGWLSMGDSAHRSQLEALFEAATCFVMPSLYEPAGIVYAEAGSAGVPSIGTTVGGSADFVGDGGILVDPSSSDELTSAMVTLADPSKAEALGALARRHSMQFTWPKVAQRILDALAAH